MVITAVKPYITERARLSCREQEEDVVVTSERIFCSLTQPAAFAGKLGIVSFHQEIFTSLKYVFFFFSS